MVRLTDAPKMVAPHSVFLLPKVAFEVVRLSRASKAVLTVGAAESCRRSHLTQYVSITIRLSTLIDDRFRKIAENFLKIDLSATMRKDVFCGEVVDDAEMNAPPSDAAAPAPSSVLDVTVTVTSTAVPTSSIAKAIEDDAFVATRRVATTLSSTRLTPFIDP